MLNISKITRDRYVNNETQGCVFVSQECQTKGLTISVLLDGGKRPFSKMLQESNNTIAHHVHNESQWCVFVSRKCQTKGLTISVLLDGSERPLSKMLEESLKQQKTRSPCPQ